jgi:tRNA(fMet)-specific endonuclease VapC
VRPIALDTNTYVGYKRGDKRCVEVIRRAERLLLGVTVLGELLAGFACGEREAKNRLELRQFLDNRRVETPPVGMATADAYGLIYRNLRLRGRPIPANDLWIAASCLEHGAVLFSFDAHFEQVDGLRVIRQWADALP